MYEIKAPTMLRIRECAVQGPMMLSKLPSALKGEQSIVNFKRQGDHRDCPDFLNCNCNLIYLILLNT